MRVKARRGLVPAHLLHKTLLTDPKVPPGLSDYATATLWQKHGDHPSVEKLERPLPLEDVNEIVKVKNGRIALYKGRPPVPAPRMNGRSARNGEERFQIRLYDARIRRVDPQGYAHDYLLLPGFYVIENDSDGVVWAVSPFHFRAWFEPIG
jgi:hypothetical protein